MQYGAVERIRFSPLVQGWLVNGAADAELESVIYTTSRQPRDSTAQNWAIEVSTLHWKVQRDRDISG